MCRMSTTQDFEDSLIDWTSPVVERNLSRPLIPLPSFISSQNDIGGDNPFDALERQVNDEVHDFLNTSSSLLVCDQNSSIRNKGQNSIPATAEILIRLDDDDNLNKSDTELHLLNVKDLRFLSSLMKKKDIHDVVVGRVSTCSDQALKNNASIVFQTPHYSVLGSGDTLSRPLHSEENGGLDECILLSDHKLLWNSFIDVEEDIMSITMPTWCDGLSSSDEEYDAHFSQSLPVQHSELSSKKIPSQILRVNTKGDLHKQALTREKLETRIHSGSMKKEKSKQTSLSKQKDSPRATSTPYSHRDILEKQETHRVTPCIGSRRSLVQKKTVSRAPSPDSTSNLCSGYLHKITSKDRVTKLGKTRQNLPKNSEVSSSQTSMTNKLSNRVNIHQKGNHSSFGI